MGKQHLTIVDVQIVDENVRCIAASCQRNFRLVCKRFRNLFDQTKRTLVIGQIWWDAPEHRSWTQHFTLSKVHELAKELWGDDARRHLLDCFVNQTQQWTKQQPDEQSEVDDNLVWEPVATGCSVCCITEGPFLSFVSRSGW